MTDVYIQALHRALPRLLACFNADRSSNLAGVGDRYFWGWKLIDFPNGSFQAASHGLAILVESNLLPEYVSEEEIIDLIGLSVRGLRSVTAKNGSLDEALPHEASYCATALVASDVLATIQILKKRLAAVEVDAWMGVVDPLIEFLKRQDEHHALISNHLASGALAMFRWHAMSGDAGAENRGMFWLHRIRAHQSREGWFCEYGNADPGYQTWCTTQLAQLHLLRPDLELLPDLEKSLEFLTLAAHPDGSFGGAYGSRNTRFLLPGGIEMLSGECSRAAALAKFARTGIEQMSCVTLDVIDAGNLVPFFNDYALAAQASKNIGQIADNHHLPCAGESMRRWFPESGWLVDRGERHYSIINCRRGGAAVHFVDSVRKLDDPGVVVQDLAGKLYSSQLSECAELAETTGSDDELSLKFELLEVSRPHPGALDFLILRILSITLLKSLYLGNLIKKFLAYWLISRKLRAIGTVRRKYRLGENFLINDTIDTAREVRQLSGVRHFSAIHMASQGYWQRGDGPLGTDRK